MSAFVEAMAFLRAMPAFAKADGVFLRAMPAFAEATAGDVERTGFEPPDSYRETPTL